VKKQFSGAGLGQTLQDGCLVNLTWRDMMTQLFSPPPRHNEQLQKIITKNATKKRKKRSFLCICSTTTRKTKGMIQCVMCSVFYHPSCLTNTGHTLSASPFNCNFDIRFIFGLFPPFAFPN
jgi:hypothetical protein